MLLQLDAELDNNKRKPSEYEGSELPLRKIW